MTNLESVKISDGLNSRERRTLKYHLKEVVNRIWRKRMERLVLRALEKRWFHENGKSSREYDKLVRQARDKAFAVLLQLYLRFKWYYSKKFKIDGNFGRGSKKALQDYMNLSHHKEKKHLNERITSKELKHLSPSLRAIWRKYGPSIKKAAKISGVSASFIFKMWLAEVGTSVNKWNKWIYHVEPGTRAWWLTQITPATKRDILKYAGRKISRYRWDIVLYQLLLWVYNLKRIARKKRVTLDKALVYHNTWMGFDRLSKRRIISYFNSNPAIVRKLPSYMKSYITKRWRKWPVLKNPWKYSTAILKKIYFKAAYALYNRTSYQSASNRLARTRYA